MENRGKVGRELSILHLSLFWINFVDCNIVVGDFDLQSHECTRMTELQPKNLQIIACRIELADLDLIFCPLCPLLSSLHPAYTTQVFPRRPWLGSCAPQEILISIQ